ncbi:PREDICTED: protein IQ-DOMAIN 14-like isoform X1 [Miniopterus natalensis]|uniref:protein IQ-DOMAIN 14-like isoform X1 n=1 Tax=Miniopterus natalensis TaxID=291302 RepID=UPI0007A703F9|nr:PREDICTED: protein IQ-DOMAIN 14-like isoform X1 [Miniopterus natalensis]
MVRCDGERGVKPPGLPEHSRLEPRDAECPADLCPFGFRKEFDTTAALGPQEPSRRQEMVLPSSCLGLGPRTSSSPSSSDSTICCNWNHYTTRLRNRLQKVKPKDRDVPGPPAPPRRAAPAAAPAPTATPSSQPPRRGLETTASRAPRRHHTPSSPPSFSGFSLCRFHFFPPFSVPCSAGSAPGTLSPLPPD